MKQVTCIEYSWIRPYLEKYDSSVTYHSLTGLEAPRTEVIAIANPDTVVKDVKLPVPEVQGVLMKRTAEDAALSETVNAAKARYLARKK